MDRSPKATDVSDSVRETEEILREIGAKSHRYSLDHGDVDRVYTQNNGGDICIVGVGKKTLVGLPHMQENNRQPIRSLLLTIGLQQERERLYEDRDRVRRGIGVLSGVAFALTCGLTHRFTDYSTLQSFGAGLVSTLPALPALMISEIFKQNEISALERNPRISMLLEGDAVVEYLRQFKECAYAPRECIGQEYSPDACTNRSIRHCSLRMQ